MFSRCTEAKGDDDVVLPAHSQRWQDQSRPARIPAESAIEKGSATQKPTPSLTAKNCRGVSAHPNERSVSDGHNASLTELKPKAVERDRSDSGRDRERQKSVARIKPWETDQKPMATIATPSSRQKQLHPPDYPLLPRPISLSEEPDQF